jgi:DeoR/GlpR family transcriptional regulator of sugar metabolism
VVANFQISTIDGIDKLISDERLDPAAMEALSASSVECLLTSASPVKT